MNSETPLIDGVLVPTCLPPRPTKIAPSHASILTECGLRYAWLVGYVPQLLATRPSVRLGTAVHELLSRAGSGRLSADPTAIREAWGEVVEKTEARMLSLWMERSFVPLKKSVTNYEERRLRACATASKVAGDRRNSPQHHASGGLPPEQKLSAENGLLTGQLDAVLVTERGVVIRDYKTGKIYEDDDATVVKTAYQGQLRLYALLYQRTQDRWPDRLQLVDARSNVVDIPFTPEECESLFATLRDSLHTLSEQIRQVQMGSLALSAVAQPGDACKWCQHRPACPAHRELIERPPSERTGDVDIYGVLRKVTTGRQGLVSLDIEQRDAHTTVSHLDPSESRNPALSVLSPGDSVAVFDARQNESQPLRAGANTIVYKVNVE